MDILFFHFVPKNFIVFAKFQTKHPFTVIQKKELPISLL